MVAIITGNILSTSSSSIDERSLDHLKTALLSLGLRPFFWEIFLGTSFQAITDEPEKALKTALLIKASLKSQRNIDVRLSIGIGQLSYRSSKITECQGEAFSKSLFQFDLLTATQQNLGINTPWDALNEYLNASTPMLCSITDNWKPSTAKIIMAYIAQHEPKQTDLAATLGLSQAAVSTALKRGHWAEINAYSQWLELKIKSYSTIILDSKTSSEFTIK